VTATSRSPETDPVTGPGLAAEVARAVLAELGLSDRADALEAAVGALGGAAGSAAVFIQDTEPVVAGAALWIRPGGGLAIQEA
jgi:hypothetical protein